MSVWLDKPRRPPEGGHKASGRTTMRSAFQNFAEILSWFEPHPDGVTMLSGRSHFSCTQFRYQGFARPDQGNGRPNGWLDARNFHISSSRVRTMKAVVQTSEFWMCNLPYGWAHPDGNPHLPNGCSDLSIFVFWKETCKARSNLCKLDVDNTKKQLPDLLFLSSPNSTCNILSREIWGK